MPTGRPTSTSGADNQVRLSIGWLEAPPGSPTRIHTAALSEDSGASRHPLPNTRRVLAIAAGGGPGGFPIGENSTKMSAKSESAPGSADTGPQSSHPPTAQR